MQYVNKLIFLADICYSFRNFAIGNNSTYVNAQHFIIFFSSLWPIRHLYGPDN